MRFLPGPAAAQAHGQPHNGTLGSPTEIEPQTPCPTTETALAIQAQADAILALAAATAVDPGWRGYGGHDVAGVRYSTT
jgi:hypothetical protein